MTDLVQIIARAMLKARGWNADEILAVPSTHEGLRKLYLKLARAAAAAIHEAPHV